MWQPWLVHFVVDSLHIRQAPNIKLRVSLALLWLSKKMENGYMPGVWIAVKCEDSWSVSVQMELQSMTVHSNAHHV